jgi:predicted negative regulator of RcsB-dependent stress response
MLGKIFAVIPPVVDAIKSITKSDKKSVKSIIAGAVIVVVSFIALQYTTPEQIEQALDVAEQINETINQINIDEPEHE